MALESSFVATPYGTFHVEATGTGKPLLFLHGGTSSTRTWHRMLERLGKHAFCVAVDRLGCGLSDRAKSYHQDDLTAGMYALADALRWDRFGVVGASAGGWQAIAMTVARPERISRLVLVDALAGPMSDEQVTEWRARRPSGQVPADPAEIDAAIESGIPIEYADVSRVNSTMRDNFRWQLEQVDPTMLPKIFDQEPELFQRIARERYDSLHLPTLVIWGKADAILPAEWGTRLTAAIPGSRYVELPGVGHNPHNETPDEFVAVVAPFLDATTGA
jgi:pimeloyl-ACP methyl ester carboxylesterase